MRTSKTSKVYHVNCFTIRKTKQTCKFNKKHSHDEVFVSRSDRHPTADQVIGTGQEN